MATPAAEETVSEAVERVRRAGFTVDFIARRQRVFCPACRQDHDPRDIELVELHRFEGVSDPDDEAVVAALRCRVCGSTGTLVTGYGPLGDPEEGLVLAALADRRPLRRELRT